MASIGFRLNLSCDNAAFGDNDAQCDFEVARILREVADRIEHGEDHSKYRNILGTFKRAPVEQL
jgi:hypothetical protein